MVLQHLILGLLKYGPLSGYDLNKAFAASARHFWNTEQSQIYRALYKMDEAGWVATETVAQDGLPNKKLYRLTESGREELRYWLATPQPLPPAHEEWLGQLFFGAELDRAQLTRLLETRIAMLRRVVGRFEREIPAAARAYAAAFDTPRDLGFWLLTVDYGLDRLRFELHWAEQALRRIAELAAS